MPPHLTFQRTTRIPQSLPKGEVEIPPPPPMPHKPSVSLLTILLPAGGTVLGLVIMIAFGATAGGANLILSMAISIPMMAATYLATFINYVVQQNKFKKDVEKRKDGYERILKARRQELTALHAQQQSVLRQNDPEPQECLSRVKRLDRRLWERSPQDADFLSLRLGLGAQPSTVTIKPPKEQTVLEPDPLVETAQNLAREFEWVPNVPICLPLREVGSAGLVGPREAVLNTSRALAIQVATHHSPDEVKIVAIFPEREMDDWGWVALAAAYLDR